MYNMKNEDKKENGTKKYNFRIQEVFILVSITCLFSFFSGMSMERVKKSNDSIIDYNNIEISDELQNFIDNYNNILNNYYENLDEEELLNAALRGMLSLLDDPYSTYMEEDEYNNMNIILNGGYKGLGVSITKNDMETITVTYVFDNSPAAKAGIKIGDIIKSVNGIDTKELTTQDFSEMIINGEENEFNLVINRNNEDTDFVVKRDEIIIDSVTSKVFNKGDKKIGYIDISSFSMNTSQQFEKNLKLLEKQKIDSLIIDVRSNTGGHLTAVENILSLLLDSSHVIYQLEQNNKKIKIYSTGSETIKYPIVVLSNDMSASASEILIGSLKDNLDAKIIGTKSYGKGTVQELSNLSNGDQYKITTKKWLTPNGDWVNDTKGIEPDINIELSEDYINNPTDENDNQLQRALEYFVN